MVNLYEKFTDGLFSIDGYALNCLVYISDNTILPKIFKLKSINDKVSRDTEIYYDKHRRANGYLDIRLASQFANNTFYEIDDIQATSGFLSNIKFGIFGRRVCVLEYKQKYLTNIGEQHDSNNHVNK